MKNEKKENMSPYKSQRITVLNSVVCLIATITSVVLAIAMMQFSDVDTGTAPFSAIGEANRALFILWGVATAIALYTSMMILARRLKFKSRIFEIALAIGCSMVIVTSAVVGGAPAVQVIHRTSAGLFGLICAVCILVLFIVKMRKRQYRRRTATYITVLSFAGIIFLLTTIYVGWFTASTQILVINVALVTMFLSNFVEKWTIE